jgi:L-asparaginase
MKTYLYIILILLLVIILVTVSPLLAQASKAAASSDVMTRPGKREHNNRDILIIYTGGTIGMKETAKGFAPDKGYIDKQLGKILSLYPSENNKIGRYKFISFDPLLDSSNMTPKDWNKIIRTIENNYNSYDSFIVLHGTDTLAYTASALSFAFLGLTKPIIVTGSQLTIEKLKNDGRNNLITSLLYASDTRAVNEVVVIFDNDIIRGNRTVKISPNKFAAFGSPNYALIGKYGVTFELNSMVEKLQKSTILEISYYNTDIHIPIEQLAPGKNWKIVTNNIKHASEYNVVAIIILTFGIGNGPTKDEEFMHALHLARSKQINVFNITQCLEGRVDEGDYATGSGLKDAGVVGGKDMTIEAAYTKALYLASKFPGSYELINKYFQDDLRGELRDKSQALFDPLT